MTGLSGDAVVVVLAAPVNVVWKLRVDQSLYDSARLQLWVCRSLVSLLEDTVDNETLPAVTRARVENPPKGSVAVSVSRLC